MLQRLSCIRATAASGSALSASSQLRTVSVAATFISAALSFIPHRNHIITSTSSNRLIRSSSSSIGSGFISQRLLQRFLSTSTCRAAASSRGSGSSSSSAESNPPSRVLLITGVPRHATSEQVRAVFLRDGIPDADIEQVIVIPKRSGFDHLSQTVALMQMTDIAAANKVLKLQAKQRECFFMWWSPSEAAREDERYILRCLYSNKSKLSPWQREDTTGEQQQQQHRRGSNTRGGSPPPPQPSAVVHVHGLPVIFGKQQLRHWFKSVLPTASLWHLFPLYNEGTALVQLPSVEIAQELMQLQAQAGGSLPVENGVNMVLTYSRHQELIPRDTPRKTVKLRSEDAAAAAGATKNEQTTAATPTVAATESSASELATPTTATTATKATKKPRTLQEKIKLRKEQAAEAAAAATDAKESS